MPDMTTMTRIHMGDVMVNLDEMEKFSQEMIERGIGNVEPGASCYETVELINRLRKAEKDAARCRWLMQNAKLGIGRNGKDWDLQIDGPAPESISEVGEWIDNRIDGGM